MKKLMVIVATVAMAAAAQAASFSWQLATGTAHQNMSVYCIKGTTAANVIEAFRATDSVDTWAAVVSGLTPKTAPQGNARTVTSGGLDGVSDGDNIVFAIINGGISDGNTWYVLADYQIPTGATFEPPLTGTPNKISIGTPTSGTFTLGTEPVPEPTTGLLLLLGVAGLALRRKQK